MAFLIVKLDPHAHPDELGLIPSFIEPADPRPAAAQFDENYQHGGGWRPLPNFTLTANKSLCYPGDPPMKPLYLMRLRTETILVYRYGFVAIVQPGGAFEAARLD